MDGADTGMSEQRANGNKMVQQQRNQIKHILHQIKKSSGRTFFAAAGASKIGPVSVSADTVR